MAINTLDGLPVELKICILQQMPDVQTIRDLVLASSKYHQTYDRVRLQILFDLLLRNYNDELDLAEAVVTMRSEGVIAEDISNKDKILDLLDCRRRWTRESKKKFKHDSFTIDEIIRLIKFHKAAVYFMEDYATSIPQPSWWQTIMHGKWEPPVNFSHTERARFLRAFYRLQTWCHIFGQPEYHHTTSSSNREPHRASENEWPDKVFTLEEGWRLIWGTMPPWEIEEVGCLLEYFMLKYIQIFQEITTALIHGNKPGSADDDTSPASPSSSSFPPGALSAGTPIQEIYELRGDPWSLAITFRYSMIEIGPNFLYKILQQPYEYRQNAVANNLRSVFTTKLWEVTGLNDEFKLPLVSPGDRYERDDLHKVITSWPILDQPNEAWIRLWGQGKPIHPDLWLHNSMGLGHFNSYPTVHRRDWKWAYVFWDNERLQQWGVPYWEPPEGYMIL